MVCVKIDPSRRLSRSVIGMNIQFVDNGKVELHTLAIKEVTAASSQSLAYSTNMESTYHKCTL